jgi:tetratricopeptide (TPR) repeat protein
MGRFLFAIATVGLLAGVAAWAETNEQELAFQQLQEQQQATLRAVEQARQDAEAAARHNAEVLEARIKQLEEGVNEQRAREIDSLQTAHRYTLTVVGIVAGLGFLGMLMVAVLLLRSMSRRPVLAPTAGFTADTMALATLDPAQQSNARFRASLHRLEQRLEELEGTAQDAEVGPVEGSGPPVDLSGRIALLLGKGQALLNLQQADAALACFDEVIELDSTNAEAFVKKGTALERLGQLDEAINCYDQAIAVDTTMTMAYLCKGGVFNRLERYGEALQCYEQALHAQQKTGVAQTHAPHPE